MCVSVRLSVCPVRALSFESLDLETSSLVRRYIFIISQPSSYVKVKVIRAKKRDLRAIAGGWP